MVKDLIFYIQYFIFIVFKKLFSRKKREYIIFFMGKYPENFKHGFNAVLDTDSILRYSISQSTIVVRFTSTKKIVEVQQIFNKVYSGYIDSYFLFESSTANYVNFLCPPHYKHLYDKNTPQKPINDALDRIQHFIDLINKMKREFFEMFSQLQNEMAEESETNENINYDDAITMEDIDPILEKIKEKGIESLTDTEKIILKKYTNK